VLFIQEATVYPLLPALVKLLSMEAKNAKVAVGLPRQRRAPSARRNFGVDPIIAIFSPRAAGKSEAGPCESLLNVRNEQQSSSALSRRHYPAKSKAKIRKKRFG
jgi:hypothetical protein